MEMSKPKHKLPDILTSSHLIGITIMELKNAGLKEKQNEFIEIIKNKKNDLDIDSVLSIASDYVEFYQ